MRTKGLEREERERDGRVDVAQRINAIVNDLGLSTVLYCLSIVTKQKGNELRADGAGPESDTHLLRLWERTYTNVRLWSENKGEAGEHDNE